MCCAVEISRVTITEKRFVCADKSFDKWCTSELLDEAPNGVRCLLL